MYIHTSKTVLRSLLYGGASMLLIFDLFFLLRAFFSGNFVPLMPIIAGIFTSGGLLFIVYDEQRAREEDKRDHRRISRVAQQLESPLKTLEESLESIQQMPALPSDLKLKLKHMETKTNVLLENIRDVFLMMQAQEGGLSLELRQYDLCAVLKEVLDRALVFAKARNVEIVYRDKCQPAAVQMDKRLFIIALTHLLENAATYTMKPGLVNVSYVCDKKMVHILIQDRGIGINPVDYSDIWQPFSRGSRADQYDSDGIGVGLTLSRLIVRQMGGDIRLKNHSKAQGTAFLVDLPLSKQS